MCPPCQPNSTLTLAVPTPDRPLSGAHGRVPDSESKSESEADASETGAARSLLCSAPFYIFIPHHDIIPFYYNFSFHFAFIYCFIFATIFSFVFLHGSFCQGLELMPAELTEDSSNTPNLVIIGISLAAFGFLLVNASLVAWFFVHQRRKKGYYYYLLLLLS